MPIERDENPTAQVAVPAGRARAGSTRAQRGGPGADEPAAGARANGNAEPVRIVFTEDGPALVDGPVDLVTADGEVVHADRFLVAICLCKRSRSYPLCDTSHRRRRGRS